jgi:hypothetical protein
VSTEKPNLTQEGKYQATLMDYGIVQKDKQKPSLNVVIKVTGKYDAVIPDKIVNREPPLTRTMYLPITENTIEMLKEQLVVMGLKETFRGFATLDKTHSQAALKIGAEFPVWCKHNTYQGKTNERWSPSMMKQKPIESSQDAIDRLDDLFKPKLVEMTMEMDISPDASSEQTSSPEFPPVSDVTNPNQTPFTM